MEVGELKRPAAHLVELAQQIRKLRSEVPTQHMLERACGAFLYALENEIGARLVEETTAREKEEGLVEVREFLAERGD